jgi:hypothetical protein
MHEPGFEPGPPAWKARILTVVLSVQKNKLKELFAIASQHQQNFFELE